MFHDFLCYAYAKFSKSSFYKGIQWFTHGDMESRIIRIQQFCLQVAFQHQRIFPPYKNKYNGREIAVIACGPSLLEYQPIPNLINIAINRAIKDTRIMFDYLFINDGGIAVSKDDMDLFNSYRGTDCTKFYGLISDERPEGNYVISESDLLKANANRYYIDEQLSAFREYRGKFAYDISTQPIYIPGSTSFAALQFALWTNPRRIYLVGCDCTQSGHFYSTEKNIDLHVNDLISGYKALKRFAQTYYPETEIVSVNPIGLKGIFRDIYQKRGDDTH